MPLETDLLDLMQETITLEPKLGVDRWNTIQYGPPVQVKCYITHYNRRVLDSAGRENVSTVQAILAQPELTVTTEDRFTLPDGSVRAIHEVVSGWDDTGPYHLEIRA